MDYIVLNGVRYNYLDDSLIQWQKDAIDGEEMVPMTIQLDAERRIVKSLKTVPSTT